ncbi:MAG: helix-turn-helix domain-containing protein [Lachnospiraceae bacterium]|nr:helix-turn-helix domain-containing protein [Lachnospiraceae bacterium]
MYIKKMGIRIKKLRISYGYTQQQLANRLHVTKSLISAYETGQRSPSYEILIGLSSIFKVSTDYLLGVDNDSVLSLSGLTEAQRTALINLVQTMR